MSTPKNVIVFDTAEKLSEAAALFISNKAAEAIKRNGRFTIALSGGNTPERLFAKLSQPPYKDSIEWGKVFVFWGDERCVALDDERNNAHKAKILLLDKINIPAGNIYRIPSDFKPDKAAHLYEDAIKHFFNGAPASIDLILLGLGGDGHTASLFPFTDVLDDTSHLIASQYVESQGMYRITMTATFINMSRDILFLVSGEDKAEILDIVINGDRDPGRYPAQIINPHSGGLYWYIDKGAAKLLRFI